MNEEESKNGKRVRRRASRSAGPTGADADAASTVVPSGKPAGESAVQATAPVAVDMVAPAKSRPLADESEVAAPTLPAQSPEPLSEPQAQSPVSGKLIGGIVLASIVAIAFAVVSVLMLVDRNQAAAAAEERSTYVAGARTTALNLTTLHAETVAADLDKFLAGTTEEFQAQLDGEGKESFVSVLGQLGVETDGEILEAGLENAAGSENAEGDCGTSLVAVRTMQKNAEQPEPEERHYRLRITMCDTDGQLLASNVEFVP